MALQTSGRISFGDINEEQGRPRETRISLAGGTVPQPGTLFGEANDMVDKNAPHKMSEFYGYDHSGSTEPYMYVTPGGMTLTPDAQAFTLEVKSNTNWTLTIEVDFVNTNDSLSGNGDATLMFTVPYNSTSAVRVGSLVFYAPDTDNKYQFVSVLQNAAFDTIL